MVRVKGERLTSWTDVLKSTFRQTLRTLLYRTPGFRGTVIHNSFLLLLTTIASANGINCHSVFSTIYGLWEVNLHTENFYYHTREVIGLPSVSFCVHDFTSLFRKVEVNFLLSSVHVNFYSRVMSHNIPCSIFSLRPRTNVYSFTVCLWSLSTAKTKETRDNVSVRG